jgi:hypothetical protein
MAPETPSFFSSTPPPPTPMVLEAIDPRVFMTDVQLVDTFVACGIPITDEMLSARAKTGDGPPFRVLGRSQRIYQWGDAVVWVRHFLGEPAHTMAEHRERVGGR